MLRRSHSMTHWSATTLRIGLQPNTPLAASSCSSSCSSHVASKVAKAHPQAQQRLSTSSSSPASQRDIRIRDAQRSDLAFLGRIMLLASRSHLDKGLYDVYFPNFTDDDHVALLADMADCPSDGSWSGSVCCFDGFLVAEVDGMPAAALAGYGSDTKTTAAYLDSMWATLQRRHGWSRADFDRQVMAKREAFDSVNARDPRPMWVVDWVAALPEFRQLGLVGRLLSRVLERGRERGYETAEVSVFLDNDPAIRAYERKGFYEYQSITSPVWQRYVACPGMMRLLQPLAPPEPDQQQQQQQQQQQPQSSSSRL